MVVIVFQIKSMTEHLARSNKLHALRSMRFPKPFCEDVSALVLMMTKEIVDHYLQVYHGHGGGEGAVIYRYNMGMGEGSGRGTLSKGIMGMGQDGRVGGDRYLRVYHGNGVWWEGAIMYRYRGRKERGWWTIVYR